MPALGGCRPWEGSLPALGGCRPPGEVFAGPVRVQAARRGLCRPWEGTGSQEGSVPALGGCRPAGGVCAGPVRVQAGRRGLCRPGEGRGRQERARPALIGCIPPRDEYRLPAYVYIYIHIYILLPAPALLPALTSWEHLEKASHPSEKYHEMNNIIFLNNGKCMESISRYGEAVVCSNMYTYFKISYL